MACASQEPRHSVQGSTWDPAATEHLQEWDAAERLAADPHPAEAAGQPTEALRAPVPSRLTQLKTDTRPSHVWEAEEAWAQPQGPGAAGVQTPQALPHGPQRAPVLACAVLTPLEAAEGLCSPLQGSPLSIRSWH